MIAFSRRDAKHVCDFLHRLGLCFCPQIERRRIPADISSNERQDVGCSEANSQYAHALSEVDLRETFTESSQIPIWRRALHVKLFNRVCPHVSAATR